MIGNRRRDDKEMMEEEMVEEDDRDNRGKDDRERDDKEKIKRWYKRDGRDNRQR